MIAPYFENQRKAQKALQPVNTLNKRTSAKSTTQINAIALQRDKDKSHTLCGLDEAFWTEEKY